MMTDRPHPPDRNSTFELLDPDSPFWRFSLSFYSRPGVAPACLALQNQRGVDVNVLLLAIYAAVQRGRLLTSADLQAADDAVRAWRVEIVEKLRHIRTRLKFGPAPAPSSATEDLRTHIKAAELKAEQIEQALLMKFLGQLPPPSAPAALDADSILECVIQHFSDTSSDTPPALEISQAIHVLTNAINYATSSS